MRHVFGMLVETAEVVVRPKPGILVTGPAIGTPEPGQLVTLRGTFSTPTQSSLLAVVQFHRTPLYGKVGIVLPETGLAPGTVIGGVIYEEGALFRVFGAFIEASPRRAAARFVLSDGATPGLVRIQGDMIDAVIIGGPLAEDRSLWADLERIECADLAPISRSDLKEPMGEVWLVPALTPESRAQESSLRSGDRRRRG